MASIFGTAVAVIAWLKNKQRIPNGQLKSYSLSDVLSTNPPLHEIPVLDSADLIAMFFDHEYWHRRWIVQEIALARSVHISCGKTTVPLAYVKTMFRNYGLLVQEHNTFLRGFRHEPKRLNGNLATRLCSLQESGSGKNSTLEKLISDYASTDCRDRLDKVFAFVSMSKLASEHFGASYELSPVDLLLRTVELSSRVEDLESTRTIAFAHTLISQLRITEHEFNPEPGRKYPELKGWSMKTPYVTPSVSSFLCRRGIVTSSVIDSTLFNAVQALREDCMELRQLNLPLLLKSGSSKIYSLERGERATSARTEFEFEPYEKWMRSPRGLVCLHLAEESSCEKSSCRGSGWVCVSPYRNG